MRIRLDSSFLFLIFLLFFSATKRRREPKMKKKSVCRGFEWMRKAKKRKSEKLEKKAGK